MLYGLKLNITKYYTLIYTAVVLCDKTETFSIWTQIW